MSSQNFVGSILKGFSDAFQPLEDSLSSVDDFAALLSSFGWALDRGGDFGQVTSAFKPVTDALSALEKAVQALVALGPSPSAAQMESVISSLVDAIKAVVTAIRTLSTGPAFVQPSPAPLDKPEFWMSFPQELLEWLLYTYVKDYQPVLFGVLHLLGVLTEWQVTTVPVFRRPYLRRGVQWQRIPETVTSPESLFTDVYGWGTAFDHQTFLGNLAKLLGAFQLPVHLLPAPRDLLDIYYDSNAPMRDRIMLLRGPLYSAVLDVGGALGYLEADLGLMAIPPTGSRSADPVGFSLFSMVFGQLNEALHIADGIDLTLKNGFESDGAIRAEIRPDGVNVATTSGLGTKIDAQATLSAKPSAPWILIGAEDSTRLELSSCHFGLGAKGNVGDLEYVIEFGADKATLVVDIGEGDGFLQQILGGKPQSLDLSTAISWSSKFGLHLSGQAQLEATLPIHQSIAGVLAVDIIYIKLRAGSDTKTAVLEVSITGALSLGPIAAAVDRVGLEADVVALDPKTDKPGNLGDLDFQFKFKPPSGLGLSIDAGAVAGGGFVSFDEDKGEYVGFLDIAIAEIIQVKFIGILDTKLPDGSKGYSLIFIIFMELPPIQLGFGFTLDGVGGIAGVNRTMSTSGLQAGLHNHTVDYLINPPRTIADAPKVISAVSSFFPPAQGRYLFGPILQLGWETTVELTVGVILEVPDPIRLAILGIIDIVLPTIEEPDLALVKIHVDVLGTLDFGTKKLAIDGSMYDSRLLQYTLMGDFAFRSSWGPNPSSLFSLGGFNPDLNTDGLDVPQLRRLSISIGDGDNPRIGASAYLALTSNTIQFGANVEAYVSEADFTVHGYLGFDLLVVIQQPTVSFEFDFAASFDVSYKGTSLAGISVTGVLTGTTPWHIHGDATLQILCFSVSGSVDHTWGESITPAPPPQAVLPDLVPALEDPQNWSAALPDGTTQAVTLSTPKSDQKTVLVHPMGTLSVRQKVIPLDRTIARYKNATPSDGTYFSINDPVKINGQKASQEPFSDYFAAAQFFTLSDADKLAAPSFEAYPAGVKIASSKVTSGADSRRTVTYREYYLDDVASPLRQSDRRFYPMPANIQLALTRQGAGFQSPLKNSGLGKYRTGPSTPAITTKDPSYIVAGVDDLSIHSDIVGAEGTSYFQARAALNSHLASHPEEAENLQIIPRHEARP